MRQIDIENVLKKSLTIKGITKNVREHHEEYCFSKISALPKKKKLVVLKADVQKLCCENPFELDALGNLKLNASNEPVIKADVLTVINKYEKVFKKKKSNFIKLYDNFRKDKKEWNGVLFIKEIGVRNCPYCGMQYIVVVIGKDSKIRAEASLDHFICKNKFPLLALNLYNLVPTCTACNSGYKGTASKTVVHPYFTELEKNIDFVIVDIDDYISNKSANLKFKIDNKASNTFVRTMVGNHVEVLKLEDRYKQFEGIAKSVIEKYHYCGDPTSAFLKKTWGHKNLLLCQDLYDDNEPFSKFKNDIWDECEDWGKK